jgi:DNA-binding SARP family transcriptional activator/tetratricopeptide (TPR) repeat protein
MLRFWLLGDVQLVVDKRFVDIGHARQRCVLAVLLVDANRPVSVDQLVDRVWGRQVPQRARATLYAYIYRLRQALAASGAAGIVRQPAGYVLTVDPLSVDLHEFLYLTDRARDTGVAGAERLALFERALRLWRGDAFGTLDTPWLSTVREDLHRQRLAAELDRNDLALAQGRHAELLAGLAKTAAAHPLDERLAGQLMLASYRSGRQADALAHYQRLRSRLADELGADPDPALQELYRRILITSPVLSAPVDAGKRETVPRQLPAPPRVFAGRADELARLDAMSTSAATAVIISAVSGTAGVGKTALAVHWAHRAGERFPDGQLYVNLRGFDPTGPALDPATAVRGFLDALGVAPQRIPSEPEALAALYRSRIAGRRMLVLLDNARDSTQVRPLLPGTPGCFVVITSRNQLTGLVATDCAQPVTLDLLTRAEARELLVQRLGRARTTAEPDAVEELIALCARLPLALSIVAARAATHPRLSLHTLAAELRDAPDRLDALTTDDPGTDVRAVFSWSYQALGAGAARLFRLLGLHPGPDLSIPAAASLAALARRRARALLAELARANLLIEHLPGRYTFHDLLRSFAADLAHTDPDRHCAIHRMLDHYLHTAHAAARLLNPIRDPITLAPAQPGVIPEHLADHERALAWFTTEHAVLLATVDHAGARGFDAHAWQLDWALWNFLDRRGHWHDQLTTGRTAEAATHRLSDSTARSGVHHRLACSCTRLGLFDRADVHLRHALDLTGGTGDPIGRAHTLFYLGYLRDRQDRNTEALDHARRAVDLYRAAGHRRGQANALQNVAWYHAKLGDHGQALVTGSRALAMLQELGDREGQAAAWATIGYAHHQLGHHSRAVTSHAHALDLFRELGDRYGEAATLIRIGDTRQATGDDRAARTAWELALTILDDLGHPDAEHVRARCARR